MSSISLVENKSYSRNSNPFVITYKNLIKLAVGTLAIPLTLTSLGTSSEAAIIHNNNFESGNFDGVDRSFNKDLCSSKQSYIDNSLYDITTEKTRNGKFALKHHIQNCDERSELVVAGGDLLKSGQEYWIGWSYLFPKNFIKPTSDGATTTIIQQMFYDKAWTDQIEGKALYECSRAGTKDGVYRTFGPPSSDMNISPDGKSYHYNLSFYKGKDSKGRYIFGCKDFTIPAILDKWEDFVMNVKFSDKKDVGFVKLWKNGQLYMNEKVALLPPGVGVGPWKIGAYTGAAGNGERILYTDEVKIGDSKSSYQEVSSPGAKLPTTALASSSQPVGAAQVPEPSLIGGLIAIGASLLLKKKQDSN